MSRIMNRERLMMAFLLIASHTGATHAQITFDWFDTFGFEAPRPDSGRDVAVDAQGNIFVTGESAVGIQVHDYTTIKYSPTGVRQWIRHYNGTGNVNDEAEKIGVDTAGNVYAAGFSWGGGNFGTGPKYDIVTIKYDTNGNQLWVNRFNSIFDNDDFIEDMVVLPDGTVYIVGFSFSPAGQPPDADYVVLKIDSDGNLLWNRFYDGPENTIDWLSATLDADATGVTVGASVEIITANGDMSIYGAVKYDPAGNVVWTNEWIPPLVPFGFPDFNIVFDSTLDPFGNFLLVGRADDGTTSDSPADANLVKFDAAGTLAWNAVNRTLNSDEFERVTTDDQGNVFAVGAFNVETNFFLHAEHLTAAYDPNGNFLWEHRFGGDGPWFDGEGYAAVNSQGDLVVATRNIMDATGENMRVFVYDRMNGTILETDSFDSGCCDWVKGMVLDAQDNIIMTGHSRPDGTNMELTVVKASIGATVVQGDINGDGVVDMNDVPVFVAVLVGTDTDSNHIAASDMNGDGAPNGGDTQPFLGVLIP